MFEIDRSGVPWERPYVPLEYDTVMIMMFREIQDRVETEQLAMNHPV